MFQVNKVIEHQLPNISFHSLGFPVSCDMVLSVPFFLMNPLNFGTERYAIRLFVVDLFSATAIPTITSDRTRPFFTATPKKDSGAIARFFPTR